MRLAISPFLLPLILAAVVFSTCVTSEGTAFPAFRGDFFNHKLSVDGSAPLDLDALLPTLYPEVLYHLAKSDNASESNSCSKTISDIMKAPLNGLGYLLNSGKSIQDLGIYSMCSQMPDAAYYTVQIKILTAVSYTGLCLPAQCSLDDVQGAIDQVTKKLPASNGPINLHNAKVANPDESSQYDLGTGSKIMIAVCILVVGLSLAGFCLEMYLSFRYEQDQKKEQRARDRGEDNDDGSARLLDNQDKENSTNNKMTRSLGEEYLARNHPEVYKQRSDRVSAQKVASSQPRPGALLKKYHSRSRFAGVFNFLLCFAFYDNLKKVCSTASSAAYPELAVLNGIRVMSIVWVIWGHSYVWLSNAGVIINEGTVLEQWPKEWSFVILMNATMSVDSFFFLGGLLSAMMLVGFFQKVGARNLGGKFGHIYFHRVFRILPLYAFLLCFFWQLAWLLPMAGPLKPYYKEQAMLCNEGWWSHLLFLNNFLPVGEDPCMDWSWYLAVDMQCFTVIPLLAFAYYKNKRLGVALTALVTATCIGVGIWVCVHFKENANLLIRAADGVIDEFYRKPYTRAPTYMVGVLYGFLYLEYKTNQKDKRENNFVGKVTKAMQGSKMVQFGTMTLGIGCIAAALYTNYRTLTHPYEWTLAENALYVALSRFTFTVGLGFVFLPNLLGVKNLLSWIMGGTFWSPLARVVYAVYLVHPILLFFYVSTLQNYLIITGTSMWFGTFANICVSFFFGGLISLLIEAPFMNLEKLLMGGGGKKKKPKTVRNETDAVAEGNPAEKMTQEKASS